MNVIERNMDGTFKKGCISANKDNHQVAWNKGMLAEPNEYTTFGDTTVMYIDSEVGDTTEIYLDTQVYEQIKQYRWTTYGKKPDNHYACRNDFGPLHRHILGLKRGDKSVVDHINRNRFDCRLCNLRITNQSVNARNHNISKINKSGYSGVHFEKDRQKWTANIRIGGKQIRLGNFKSKEAAIQARKTAEQKHWRTEE